MTDFIFFWKDTERPYGVFSQWAISKFVIDDKVYSCAEQYMMAEKARLFKDTEIENKIMSATTPTQFKQLGRKVKNFNQEVWDKNAYDIVVRGNYEKFKQNEYLLNILKSTESKVLVEASPYDKIWGIGMKADDYRAKYPRYWNGKNLLGKALVDVRSEFNYIMF